MLDDPSLAPPPPDSHQRVRELVRLIPPGEVASYGMVASLLAGVTPRIVGFAMAGLPADTDVPWQRVINASGGISPRPGAELQRLRLEEEGIVFLRSGKLDWSLYGWQGPGGDWLAAHDISAEDFFILTADWPSRRG